MFDLRMNDITRVTGPVAPPARQGLKTLTDRIAVTIVRASGTGRCRSHADGRRRDAGCVAGARAVPQRLARKHRRELAAAQPRDQPRCPRPARRRFILILAAAQRQRRLARQQMEFVAAVSHELRTPLAVICSAGENLADGVVADAAQMKTYGSLIENEGRRLGDMVERVMEFAGISSGAPIRARGDVDVAAIAADAVQCVGAEARDGGVTVTLHVEGTVPMVTADATALHSAVQNIVGNAVKYSEGRNCRRQRATCATADADVQTDADVWRFAWRIAVWASTPRIYRTSSSRSFAAGEQWTPRFAAPASA